jgi:amino acid permease
MMRFFVLLLVTAVFASLLALIGVAFNIIDNFIFKFISNLMNLIFFFTLYFFWYLRKDKKKKDN